MLTRPFREVLMMAAMALFAFLAVGCCPVTPLHVTVSLDPALISGPDKLPGQMQVDIVAINPNEHQRWRDYSMTRYWQADDAMRKSAVVFTMTLDAEKNPSQTLSATDPIWGKWLAGANEKDPPKLYVLAQIKKNWSAADDKPENKDSRRQIIPLGSCRWDKNLGSPPSVKLTVKPTAIVTDTQPKMDKPGT
jgi:hypothetical protein